MGEGKVFWRGRGRRTSAGGGATKNAREGRLVEKVVAVVMAGLGPPLLNCAVKNSRTRCAAFGVGVNSEAGCSSGARERMISVVMAWLLAARRPAGSTAPETGDYAQNPSMSVIGMLRQRLRGMSTSCSETTSVYSLSSCFKRKPGWSRALWK